MNPERCGLCYRWPPCECWKTALTPQQREDLQLAIIAKYEAKLDRLEFERREAERQGTVTRGQFGNDKAKGKRKCA